MASELFVDKLYPGPNSTSIELSATSSISFKTNGNTQLTIDSSGRLLTPNRPSFFSRPPASYNLGVGSNTIAGTWTDVFNIGSHFNNGTFTVPVTGTYQFTWNCFIQNETYRVDAYIIVNGTIVMREEISRYDSLAANKSVSVHGSYYLNVNDAITFGVHSQAGTNIYSVPTPWSYACGYLVG